jgi:hypothetical protein
MSVLSSLARVVRTTDRGTETDLHHYALANAVDIAFSLGWDLPDYLDMLDAQILAALPARLTEAMKDARKGAREEKIGAMQRAADIMGHSLSWTGDAANVDLRPFLDSIVAGPELLAFPRWGIAVSLDMLRRFRVQSRNARCRGWHAHVDSKGLHIWWTSNTNGVLCRGGLTLRAQMYHEYQTRNGQVVVCDPPAVHGCVRKVAS